MSALRLARAATNRDRVIVFEGGYHGHADPFLASAGSGLATLGIPASPGVLRGGLCQFGDMVLSWGLRHRELR